MKVERTTGQIESLDLKRSFYNLIVKDSEDNGLLLFNSLTSALALLDERAKDIYNNIEKIDKLSKDKDINMLDNMMKNGFLVPYDIDEFLIIKTMSNMERFSSKYLLLTIAPTLDCNMACPYCYENKNHEHMTNEIADEVIIFIEKYIEQYKTTNIVVTWYGGEPLLNTKVIKYLSDKIINLCNTNQIQYSASIITNGALLDIETAKLLSSLKVTSAQITIDGTRATNNIRRILKNGADSFGIITNNVIKCKDIINIVVRCNVDKSNINECNELFEFFVSNSINFYFAPVEKQTEVCNVKIDKCYTHKEFSEIQSDLLNRLYNSSNNINNIPYPYARSISCAAIGTNMFVIGPEGSLYKCWDEIGNKKQVVGTAKDGIYLNARHLQWLSLELNDKCKGCNMLPICLGGCPYKLLEGKELECHFNTINFRKKLEIYYNDFMKNNIQFNTTAV